MALHVRLPSTPPALGLTFSHSPPAANARTDSFFQGNRTAVSAHPDRAPYQPGPSSSDGGLLFAYPAFGALSRRIPVPLWSPGQASPWPQ